MQAFTFVVLAVLIYVAQGTPTLRIVGGKDVIIGKYPYQVSLRLNGSHICGGSIINNYNILTAAHCVKNYYSVPSSIMTIKAGTNNLKVGGDVYKIENIIIHQNYSTLFYDDIAIVHLSDPLKFSPMIQPVKLAITDNLISNDRIYKFTGWGRLSKDGPNPNQLQEIDLEIFPQRVCEIIFQNTIDDKLCTYTTRKYKQKGICHGDSGGPLTVNGIQVGIAIAVVPCATGYPDLFTRVPYFLPWIIANLKK